MDSFTMKLAGSSIFFVVYVLLLVFYEKKHYIVWTAVLLAVISGLLTVPQAISHIDWNVMGVFLGTLIVAYFFIESRMPSYLANVLISRTKTVRMSILAMCFLAGFISIFAENVAVVIILAPIALSIAQKLKVSAIPFLIGIAITSNLEGAATLIGDPPSMILAGYAKLTFNQFFFAEGKPGIFFAIQAGLFVGMIVLYLIFRRYREPIGEVAKENYRSLFPSALIILMVVGLAFSSNWDPEFSFLAGTICMTAALAGSVWYLTNGGKGFNFLFKEIDWNTTFFLMGIFVLVGMLTKTGVVSSIADFAAKVSGGSLLAAFMIIVWFSVLISAFIDNVPYLATMLPVAASLAHSVGAHPYLLMFGLLIGASIGGNITPIGASANIVACGLLKKEGYPVTFWQYVRIGLPFTIFSTAAASLFIWLVWA